MNYVLLDTNIIIDMVVDRRNQIDNKLLNKFLKLLEFDEIKLIPLSQALTHHKVFQYHPILFGFVFQHYLFLYPDVYMFLS